MPKKVIKNKYGLTTRQADLAEYMVANPYMKDTEVAKEVGIDPKTLYNWKKMPEFQDYLHVLCQQKFKSYEKAAIKKMYELAMNGNVAATKYLLDYAGYKAEDVTRIVEDNINITVNDEKGD